MTGWPWPLDGVQSWFEGLWNHINNVVSDLLGGLWHDIGNAFSGLSDFVSDGLAWLEENVWQRLLWLRDRVQEGADWIVTEVEKGVTWVAERVYEGLVWIGESYVNLSHWMADQLRESGRTIINTTTVVGEWLWDNIGKRLDKYGSDTYSFLMSLSSDITKSIAGGFASTEEEIEGVNTTVDAMYAGIGMQIDGQTASIWDSVVGLATDLLGGMAQKLGEAIQGFAEWLFQHLSRFANLVIGAVQFIVDKISGAVQGLIAWFTDSITGAMMKGSPPKEIEQASNVLMQTSFDRQFTMIDEIYQSEASSEMAVSSAQNIMGMLFAGGALAMSMAIAADQVHPLKNMGWRPTVRELVYWAGIPSVTAAIAVLPSSVGLLTPLRYALMERWKPLVPDAPDLIRFAVREVFIEEERERLIQPGPGAEFYKYLAKQGYSKFWGDAFWAAHWIRPTITQLTEMYYRDIIDRSSWSKEVRLNDYVPYAIDWLEQIVHPPYTRVDVRRMWEMGTIDEAQLRREYKWLGYDVEHVDGMVLWTKVYTALPDLVARYRNGWISSDDVLQTLIKFGMPKERAIEIMQTKMTKAQEERTANERDLTKADILKLLGIGEISDRQAHDFLVELGYDDTEAAYLVAIQLDKMTEQVKELTSAQILKTYRYEINTRPDVKQKLIEAGWSESAAETMLRLEDINRADTQVEKARERDLSRTDIIHAVQQEIIDNNTGYGYLAYMGYSDWEIQVIFALEGIPWPIGA